MGQPCSVLGCQVCACPGVSCVQVAEGWGQCSGAALTSGDDNPGLSRELGHNGEWVSGCGLTKGFPRLALVSPRYWCGDFSQYCVFASYPEHSEMFLSGPQNLFLESPLPCKLGEYITGLRCPRVPRTSLARGQTGHSGALSQEVALLLARAGCGSHL